MTRFGTKAIGGLALAVASVTALAACSSSSTTTPSASATAVSGGTATWAEPPTATPNYIFPFTSSSYDTVTNTNEFQFLLYRPLYWFGSGNQPTLNQALSLANYPTFSSDGKTLTITLKPYMWSNGTPVTADNVMFWLNMETAIGATNYGAYTGFPNTEVSSIKVVSPTELTMTLNKAYSQNWFVYNNLSQITPMPSYWDRTSATATSSCETTVSDCANVYKYLDSESRNLSGYVSSPLWSIVDGPWKLSAFNADGHITMVPNTKYSGPVKPKLSQFQEVPFTTDSAEYNVLRSPSTTSKVDVGYIPSEDLPAKPAGAAVGANPVSGYTLSPWYTWGINYFPVNLQSTVSDHAAIFKQTYFRQALEYLMNQEAILAGPLKGYGTLTVGPVGSEPVTTWLSPKLTTNPFTFNPTQAKNLLTSHGWTVNAGGTTTCSNPSLCGPGISSGSTLDFNLPYATGTAWIEAEMTQLQSNAAALGIKLNLQPKPFNQVVALAAGNCVVAKIPCNWDMADWGGGWSFYPDVSPTGETLFKCGAIANSGGYCEPANDALINQTLASADLTYMYNWQEYLSAQVPMIWQPNAPYAMTEVTNTLRGVLPQQPTLNLVPEEWYYVS